MKDIWPFSQETSTPTVARIIPARGMTLAERNALEGTMQSLVLQGSALALEIASTPATTQQAQSVQFLLRAPSEDALRAATRQIQVRYPQAIIRSVPPEEDPFQFQAHETISAQALPHVNGLLHLGQALDTSRPAPDPRKHLVAGPTTGHALPHRGRGGDALASATWRSSE
jgi:hypothetical protein